ncbi:tetratricopeptide repeat protein [Micromonospora sp. RTGN7]|uniref:tetratricopeptide repeat protein n=1 Tax=Micromonospora sp. RTGN7 TaxID=3016526 RepID=UPI0029FED89E|nr:tetratricopeptide repeat protein [Micromonospora sp. RTGN7]
MAQHLWITGEHAHQRLAAARALTSVPLAEPVDAHRRRYGPYTATNTLFTALMPDLLATMPDLVRRHDIEVLSVAPDLRPLVPASRETLTSLAVPAERTRFYSRVRTLRLSHGLAELLRDYVRALGGPRRTLVLDRLDEADPTDAEFVLVLLRRLDPELLTVVVGTGSGPLDEDLAAGLDRYAQRREAPPVPHPGRLPADPARAYVASDCCTDDPALLAAYAELDPDTRCRLHAQRAEELLDTGLRSPRLGAVPHHLERAGDPAVTGAKALLEALNYCVDMGFYHATLDLGRRGRAVVDRAAQEGPWWAFTTKMTTSLSALGRPEEAEALYDEARALSVNPIIHRQAAYATAMIHTRHREREHRDHVRARAWINQAIAIASLQPEGADRSFSTVFQQNGLALIEMHLGNLPGALRLVCEGLDHLDRELGADEHRLHRSVLLHNRAQVLAALGRLDEALADFTAVIADDPNYPEYHFDRANLLHRLGRDDEALAGYAEAIRLSPPFPEAHYNRADVLAGLGDLDAALADLGYVLELDPTNADALVNRAGLYAALDDAPALRADLAAGLALDRANPHLLCLLGQVQAEEGRAAEAEQSYRRALEADPDVTAAWSGLAALAFDAGDLRAAVDHLDRALTVGDDAALRYNRATAYRALGRYDEALADLTRAAELDPADADIRRERAECGRALAGAGGR